MNRVVDDRHKQRDDELSGDFAALFKQLDCPDTCAPINHGLHRLLTAMEGLRRPPGNFR